ncbi:hypothetical protein [Thermocrispum sp.]|jgi:hypothetical protein|uniref:YggT family protein n=1 Tax=Thermocrispum agreste TaxID=37925 RepID=A0A2W4JNV2_9PSEU|nr:hypothetical protein [Thermocrispum sp.]PZN00731.1 MAG: hypothetical protein DIU77_02840 [Thermocrispum agreste]
MGEHTDKPAAEQTTAKRDVDWGEIKDRFVGLLAGVVRWVCLIFALILVLHVVFVVAEANPANGVVQFVDGWADRLTLGVGDLFTPDDAKLRTLINYGIAAVLWLIISNVGSKIIRRVGGVRG